MMESVLQCVTIGDCEGRYRRTLAVGDGGGTDSDLAVTLSQR